jgi:phosphomevalonate kinase
MAYWYTHLLRFGQEKRSTDPWYFCKLATTQLSAISTDEPKKPLVWIVSDARYPTDISYFRDVYKNKVKLVRVVANDNVRASRGWIHVDGK